MSQLDLKDKRRWSVFCKAKKLNTKEVDQVSSQTDDKLATEKTLNHFRNELKSDISGLRNEIKMNFKLMEARFDRMEARMDKADAKVERTLALCEQRNHENKILFDVIAQNTKNIAELKLTKADKIDLL